MATAPPPGSGTGFHPMPSLIPPETSETPAAQREPVGADVDPSARNVPPRPAERAPTQPLPEVPTPASAASVRAQRPSLSPEDGALLLQGLTDAPTDWIRGTPSASTTQRWLAMFTYLVGTAERLRPPPDPAVLHGLRRSADTFAAEVEARAASKGAAKSPFAAEVASLKPGEWRCCLGRGEKHASAMRFVREGDGGVRIEEFVKDVLRLPWRLPPADVEQGLALLMAPPPHVLAGASLEALVGDPTFLRCAEAEFPPPGFRRSDVCWVASLVPCLTAILGVTQADRVLEAAIRRLQVSHATPASAGQVANHARRRFEAFAADRAAFADSGEDPVTVMGLRDGAGVSLLFWDTLAGGEVFGDVRSTFAAANPVVASILARDGGAVRGALATHPEAVHERLHHMSASRWAVATGDVAVMVPVLRALRTDPEADLSGLIRVAARGGLAHCRALEAALGEAQVHLPADAESLLQRSLTLATLRDPRADLDAILRDPTALHALFTASTDQATEILDCLHAREDPGAAQLQNQLVPAWFASRPPLDAYAADGDTVLHRLAEQRPDLLVGALENPDDAGRLRVALTTVRDGRGMTAYARACRAGALELVRSLIAHAPRLAQDSASGEHVPPPLSLATRCAERAGVQTLCTLLEAALEAQREGEVIPGLETADSAGATPLRHAAERGHLDACALFLALGASVDTVAGDGATPRLALDVLFWGSGFEDPNQMAMHLVQRMPLLRAFPGLCARLHLGTVPDRFSSHPADAWGASALKSAGTGYPDTESWEALQTAARGGDAHASAILRFLVLNPRSYPTAVHYCDDVALLESCAVALDPRDRALARSALAGGVPAVSVDATQAAMMALTEAGQKDRVESSEDVRFLRAVAQPEAGFYAVRARAAERVAAFQTQRRAALLEGDR